MKKTSVKGNSSEALSFQCSQNAHKSDAVNKHCAHTGVAKSDSGQKAKVKRNCRDISRAKEASKGGVLTGEGSGNPSQYKASALKSKVKSNKKKKDPIKIYKCRHCDTLLKTKQLRKLHEVTHFENVSPQACNVVHEEPLYLGQLTQTHSESQPRKCKCCCSHHGGDIGIVAHNDTNTRRESWGHNGCNITVQPNSKFQNPGKCFQSVGPQHFMGAKFFPVASEGRIVFECASCKATFNTEKVINNHTCVQVEQNSCIPYRFACTHSSPLQDCAQCRVTASAHKQPAGPGSVFTNLKGGHSKTLHDKESLNCGHCFDIVSQSFTVNYLRLSCTSGMLYECKSCRTSFKEKKELKKHIKSHPGIKPYQCLLCGSQYCSRKKFREHCKTHREHNCPRDQCGNSSLSRRHRQSDYRKMESTQKVDMAKLNFNSCDLIKVNYQIKSYHGGMLFECKVCKAVCSTKKNVKSHIKHHAGEKTYKCTHCLSQFFGKQKAKNHVLEHVRDKVCGSAHFEHAFAKLLPGQLANACFRKLNNSNSNTQENLGCDHMSSHAYPVEGFSEAITQPQEGLNVSVQNKRKKAVVSQDFNPAQNCNMQDSFLASDFSLEPVQKKKRKTSRTSKESRAHTDVREKVAKKKSQQVTQQKHVKQEIEMKRGNAGTCLTENHDNHIEGDSFSEILGLEANNLCDIKEERIKIEVDSNAEDCGSKIDTGMTNSNKKLKVNDNPSIDTGMTNSNEKLKVNDSPSIDTGMSNSNKKLKVNDSPSIDTGMTNSNKKLEVNDSPSIDTGMTNSNKKLKVNDSPSIVRNKENSDVDCKILEENICAFHEFKEEKFELEQEVPLNEDHCSFKKSKKQKGKEVVDKIVDLHSEGRAGSKLGGLCSTPSKAKVCHVSKGTEGPSETNECSLLNESQSSLISGKSESVLKSPASQSNSCPLCGSESEQLQIVFNQDYCKVRKVLELMPKCKLGIEKLQEVARLVDDLNNVLQKDVDKHAQSDEDRKASCNVSEHLELETTFSNTDLQDETRNTNWSISEALEMETTVSNTGIQEEAMDTSCIKTEHLELETSGISTGFHEEAGNASSIKTEQLEEASVIDTGLQEEAGNASCSTTKQLEEASVINTGLQDEATKANCSTTTGLQDEATKVNCSTSVPLDLESVSSLGLQEKGGNSSCSKTEQTEEASVINTGLQDEATKANCSTSVPMDLESVSSLGLQEEAGNAGCSETEQPEEASVINTGLQDEGAKANCSTSVPMKLDSVSSMGGTAEVHGTPSRKEEQARPNTRATTRAQNTSIAQINVLKKFGGVTAEVHGIHGTKEERTKPNTKGQETSLTQKSIVKESIDGFCNYILSDFQLYLQNQCKVKDDYDIRRDTRRIGDLLRHLHSSLKLPCSKDIDHTLLFLLFKIDFVKKYYQKRKYSRIEHYSLLWFISYMEGSSESGMQIKNKQFHAHLVHSKAIFNGYGLLKLKQFVASHADEMSKKESMLDFIERPLKDKEIQNCLASLKDWYESSRYGKLNHWCRLDVYSFIVGYIINYLIINCDIHHLVVKNMTINEVSSAIPNPEDRKRSMIINIKSVNKWRLKDGRIILDNNFYRIMIIYWRCYRKASPGVIWFLTKHDRQISNPMSLIRMFRRAFRLGSLDDCGYDYNRKLFNATLSP